MSNSNIPATIEAVRNATKKIAEGQAFLSQQFGPLTPEQMNLLLALSMGPSTTSTPVVTKPKSKMGRPASVPNNVNVGRIGLGVRSTAIVGGRPALRWAIAIVLKENGNPMNADQVFAELDKRNWLPAKAANPRFNVGHALSINKSMFPRVERGVYKLADDIETSAKVDKRPADVRLQELLTKHPEGFGFADLRKAMHMREEPLRTILKAGIESGQLAQLNKGRGTKYAIAIAKADEAVASPAVDSAVPAN